MNEETKEKIKEKLSEFLGEVINGEGWTMTDDIAYDYSLEYDESQIAEKVIEFLEVIESRCRS